MKKAAALLFSVLFYIGAFALAFLCASEQNLLYFACILPPDCSSVLCDCRKYFRPPAGAEPLAVMVCAEFCWRNM